MERQFFKSGDYQILKIIAASPEEGQQHDGVHPDSGDWPQGYHLDVVKRIEDRRIVHYIGLARVGERLAIPGDKDKPLVATPPKRVPDMPAVVKKQDKETAEQHAARLEVMAARNGIEVNDNWRKRPLVARQMDVSEAMRKLNAA
jgi:hypothetical protein